ncbi:MAG: hypothetical protein ABSA12_17605 [Verrucomicrobiia bacterium]|jgi:hypothetical protein
MISKNLARRLERLEESLLPVLEEPLVIHIIAVDGDGRKEGQRHQDTQHPGPRNSQRRLPTHFSGPIAPAPPIAT